MSTSDNIASYSFLPWVRQGLSTRISAVSGLRASVTVSVTVASDTGESKKLDDKRVLLVGPGDITAISSDQFIRTEPKNQSADFEPNYFPFIEFYDEDFPWRYSPAVADGNKLLPWLALVVLKADEFKDLATGTVLAGITVENAADLFPPSAQLWAWAHVHVNSDITASSVADAAAELKSLVETDPSIAYSRVLCARKLEPSTGYHAFLIPVFESGRCAGLGIDPGDDTTATTIAWDNGQIDFPVYTQWYFSTSSNGDFESLVRLLKPVEADPKIGSREMDMTDPGANLDGMTDPTTLGLEGALKAPSMISSDWPDPYPDALQVSLRTLVNEGAKNTESGSGDPEITPPLYGQWHALTDSLEEKTDEKDLSWLDEANLDPRNRTAAGFGTETIRKNQETYMKQAWEQVGKIVEANRKIKFGQFAKEALGNLYSKTFQKHDSGRVLQLGFPVTKKVKGSPKTLFAYINESSLPKTILGSPLRRALRLRGPLMKRTDPLRTAKPELLVRQVNEGKITATPPRVTPEGLVTLDESMAFVKPSPAASSAGASGYRKWLPLIILFVVAALIWLIRPHLLLGGNILFLTLFLVFALAMLVLTFGFPRSMTIIPEDTKPEDKAITEDELSVSAVEAVPGRPDFKIVSPGEMFIPATGADDNEVAADFRKALTDLHAVFDFSRTIIPPVKSKLDLDVTAEKLLAAMKPDYCIPKRVLSGISLGALQEAQLAESFTPVMAYPVFDDPMYEKLNELSHDYLIPNLDLLQNNSITLLETNAKFMEAYLLGLNHEMSRELLWREFPTDQRGSYFRQFWDVSEVQLSEEMSAEEKEEYLRDISEIHRWGQRTLLGTHPPESRDASWKGSLVLTVRGQLLKRYPNTVVYAVPAKWDTNADGSINKDKSRIPDDTAEKKYPVFKAKIDPDITLLGFDITAEQAKGDSRDDNGTDAGYFFVLMERPGEPRFGMDEGDGNTSGILAEWNDLSWDEVTLNGEYADAELNSGQPAPSDNPGDITWGSSSAETAWITFQEPVMVSVHASEMLI